MNVKEHYDKHLGNFYSWMTGDFITKQKEQQDYFLNRNIRPVNTGEAIDLGAGHGIQSISLAKIGFNVTAVDFNVQLLAELKQNSLGLPVEVINNDVRAVKGYKAINPELIVCAGDTITHLSGKEEINQLIIDCKDILCAKGKLILSFRDYTHALTGDDRFIPVKSDSNRILTCCLDYLDDKVLVTDLLHTKTETGWQQSISSYYKVRISLADIVNYLKDSGLAILFNETINRMVTIIAQKQ